MNFVAKLSRCISSRKHSSYPFCFRAAFSVFMLFASQEVLLKKLSSWLQLQKQLL